MVVLTSHHDVCVCWHACRGACPRAMCVRAVRLLLWRNCIRRKRAKCSSLCELFSPVIVVIMFSLIFRAFKNSTEPAQQYLTSMGTVYPMAGYAYRLQLYEAQLGLGASCCPPVPFHRVLGRKEVHWIVCGKRCTRFQVCG